MLKTKQFFVFVKQNNYYKVKKILYIANNKYKDNKMVNDNNKVEISKTQNDITWLIINMVKLLINIYYLKTKILE